MYLDPDKTCIDFLGRLFNVKIGVRVRAALFEVYSESSVQGSAALIPAASALRKLHRSLFLAKRCHSAYSSDGKCADWG